MARSVQDQLTRSSEADLHAAHQHRSVLLIAAHSLSAVCRHDLDVVGCHDAGCLLTDIDPDGRLCAVSLRLAGMVDGPTPVTTIETALPRFLAALAGSFAAIRACRQTVHPSGVCWFTNVPDTDGCAEVLQLAHRLS